MLYFLCGIITLCLVVIFVLYFKYKNESSINRKLYGPKQFEKEIRELEKEIDFFKSFPHEVNNMEIESINCIKKRDFYDTVWLIRGTQNKKEFRIQIVRSDTEKHSNLFEEIKEKCKTPSDIKLLDERNFIYYD